MLPSNDQYPKQEYLQFLVDRYKQCDLSSIQTYLAVVRIASRMQNRSDAYFQRMELSQGRFLIMMMLLQAGEAGLTPAEIAQHMSCARATVTGLLDGLESAGYAERQADPKGDRRSLIIRLTASGQKKMDSVLPAHHRRISQVVADFTHEERDQLRYLLNKFTKGLAAFDALSDVKDQP